MDRVPVNYRLARDIFHAAGMEIINATVGGNLELLPLAPLVEALAIR